MGAHAKGHAWVQRGACVGFLSFQCICTWGIKCSPFVEVSVDGVWHVGCERH